MNFPVNDLQSLKFNESTEFRKKWPINGKFQNHLDFCHDYAHSNFVSFLRFKIKCGELFSVKCFRNLSKMENFSSSKDSVRMAYERPWRRELCAVEENNNRRNGPIWYALSHNNGPYFHQSHFLCGHLNDEHQIVINTQ